MTINDTQSELHIDPFAKEKVDKQTLWERKLLNLTMNNPLLNVRAGRSYVQIVTTDLLRLGTLLSEGKSMTINERPPLNDEKKEADTLEETRHRALCPGEEFYEMVNADLSEGRLRTYLKKDPLTDSLKLVYRKGRESVELGANTLFLAIGALKWIDADDKKTEYYSPLLLFPVELVRRSATSGYTLRGLEDGETMFNITLLQKLRQVHKMDIPWLTPLPTSGGVADIKRILDIMRDCIKEYDGWAVEETALLGNFDYDTFMMWNDIHNNADVLRQNPIVGSFLSGVVDKSVNEDVQGAEDLDQAVSPGEIMLPISADSSQLEAIKAAAEGKSFILHGPPGTGKSQTITNIIANALYRGKRVLFVAEKKAALEVVYKRLADIGLAPFCLSLDSSVRKTAVMERFKEVVNMPHELSGEPFLSHAERVGRLRAEIKAHMDSLHKKYPLGLSLYDCLSLFCATKKDDSFEFLHQSFPISQDWLLSLRPEDKPRLEDVVSQYVTACSICGITDGRFSHPLSPIRAIKGTPAEIAASFNSLDIQKPRSALLRSLNVLLGEDSDNLSRKQTEAFVHLAKIIMRAECLTSELLSLREDELAELEKALESARKRDAVASLLLENYSRRVFELSPSALRREYDEALVKGPLSRVFALRTLCRKMGVYSLGTKKVPRERLSGDIELLEEYASRSADLEKVDFKKIFGQNEPVNSNDYTHFDEAISAVRVINAVLIDLYGRDREKVLPRKKKICEALRNGLSTFKQYDGHCLSELIESFEALLGGIDAMRSVVEVELPDDSVSGWVTTLTDKLFICKSELRSLRDWSAYLKARAALRSEGLGILVKVVENEEIKATDVPDFLRRSIYWTYAEYIISTDESLSDFHGVMFEEKIERFRSLCEEFESLTREEIVNKIVLGLPDWHKEASESPSVSILLKNISNHCRGISLRTLFDHIGDILPRIFPCMMMSPLSVSQMLKADAEKFDLVIFDEASQIPTCEAVGAIGRAKAVVIAGDPNQMPPTRFFQSDTFDEDNAIIEDLESILDDALALSLPSICLKWHYRSRHESLITFSNSMYYDNSLMTFPSPDDLRTKVTYEFVPGGVYEKGGKRQNKEEAKAVVKEIERRLLDPELRRQSIGVITFNISQQSLIEDLLDELYRSNPALERAAEECGEPIFIKNLENVQGDERDVILFSVGYGPDKKGNVGLNFGPLNRAGGWRRLNVAVSRARLQMKVFSTLHSCQIPVDETSAEGVIGLKKFLGYAESGVEAIRDMTSRGGEEVDYVIRDIARSIKEKWGFEVVTNIGCSDYHIDIGIVEPGSDSSRYILGILCDGYNSHSIRTVRDREIVQRGVLESLGWNVVRVWTMDWFNNSRKILADIALTLSRGSSVCADKIAEQTQKSSAF